MAADLSAQIAAVGECLAALSGHKNLDKTSDFQAKQLVALIGERFVPPEAVGHLITCARNVPWAIESHSDLVTNALSRKISGIGRINDFKGFGAHGKGLVYQCFMHFLSFLAQCDWDVLLDPNVSSANKRTCLFNRLAALTLKYPSEPTYKLITGLLLICDEGLERALNLPDVAVQASFEQTKKDFKKHVNARCPPLMIQQLPQAPGDLMRRHDDIFKACYGDELPVPGRVSDHHTALIANKILCRKRVKNDAASMMTIFYRCWATLLVMV